LANEEKGAGRGRTLVAQAVQQATAEVAAAQGRGLSRRDALRLGGVLGWPGRGRGRGP
jgi:hypothetical protein